MTGIKHTLMEILDGSPKHAISRYVEWLITIVVLVNCTAVILDSVPEVHAEFKDFFHELEFWSVMFFTGEYISRVWSLGSKYNTALQDLFHAIHSERQAFGSAVFLLTIATIVSASLMHFAEGHQQPEFFGTIPHSIYWSIVTITSGYGNVEPMTKAGEAIALITGFLGVCMAAIMTGIVASAFSNQVARKKAAFEAQLREVFKDGNMSEEEQETLQRLQAHYRLTDEQVEAMMLRAKNKSSANE
jgi:hypothetical protein